LSRDDLDRVRAREYPAPREGIFLNAASWGLLPLTAAEESAGLVMRRNRARGFEEEELGPLQRRCRTAAARLVGVSPDEIALSPNTSFGVNLAAALVGAGPVGSILLSEGEFPANVLPWKALERRGFRVDLVPTDERGWPDEDALLRRLDREDVRALGISAVQYVTGFRADLATLGSACRARGVLLCVDAIQALGVVPLDAAACGVDVLACGGQKWLCSPWGSGFTYVRRDLQERFDPPMVGWLSVRGATRFEEGLGYDMEWVESARKFELATLALQDHVGLARSVEIFLEVGLEEVAAHVRELHAPVLGWLDTRADARVVTPRDPSRRAGILSFTVANLDRSAAALREGGVVFSVREGAIRLAPHFYNTVDEMERVVEILDAVA
jgi:cysteine desulfurase/selenocysteine lyase